ncbi:hypothetical protein ACWGOE_04180 [Leucobacter chromiiresistens]
MFLLEAAASETEATLPLWADPAVLGPAFAFAAAAITVFGPWVLKFFSRSDPENMSTLASKLVDDTRANLKTALDTNSSTMTDIKSKMEVIDSKLDTALRKK